MSGAPITTGDLWTCVLIGLVFGAIIGACALEAWRTRSRR